jgi:hypothetical protein
MKVTLPTDIEKKVLDLLDKTFANSEKDFTVLAHNEANKIEVEMQSRTPVAEGTLKASIGVVKSKKNNFFFWVGPQYSNKSSAFEGGNHAHLVEFGTKERYMKKGLFAGGFTRESGGAQKFKGIPEYVPYAGKSTGKMKTNKAFIRPTYDSMGASIIENLKKGTEKIVAEQGNKQGI